jgi:DNA-binding transcriptional regulator YiaG
MSTPSSSRELFGSPVPARGENRVHSGSPVKLLLLSTPGRNNAPGTAQALIRRHLPIREAKAAAERLFDEGRAVVEVPKVESLDVLRDELTACNVEARVVPPPQRVDTRGLRHRMRLSQEQFALEFGLELSTLRNWEQGRSEPDTAANAYLLMIDRNPDAVRRALAEDAPAGGPAPAM